MPTAIFYSMQNLVEHKWLELQVNKQIMVYLFNELYTVTVNRLQL